ncbi:RsmB/NOP family class I SAM-dependent RNA methyltransferase [Primorskyibacter sp. S187A]|uniref:RsmB/NOP family class I SAM-dependent RNA methyltransferase n=1 Tax=Primorskyibacter sp. S187A TaxID=3415130 RepID=UPI003C7ACE10
MTPGARVQAAIEILDSIAAGLPTEQALTRWARASRFAGSKDRAAVRDHVFDVRRQWHSTAALGGGDTGRARMIGLCRAQGIDPDDVFTGQGHAPKELDEAERAMGAAPDPQTARDLPDWLWPLFLEGMSLDVADAQAQALRARAPVDLRVNLAKCDLETAQAVLARDDLKTQTVALARTALRVTEGARRVARSEAYKDGLVELQDAASQAVIESLPLKPGMRVLDYCAGGGGKALAMAARVSGPVDVHDASPERMASIPERAGRAGVELRMTQQPKGSYDLVLCDVPCSGSGSWRRSPDGKWKLTPKELSDIRCVQTDILRKAAGLTAEGGVLAYATCSILHCENALQVSEIKEEIQNLSEVLSRQFLLSDGGDGFFVSVLQKAG